MYYINIVTTFRFYENSHGLKNLYSLFKHIWSSANGFQQ